MQKRIMIMAAGTGGHIFPGLVLARALKMHGWSIVWLGTTTGMEGELVKKDHIHMEALHFRGLRGKGFMRFWVGLWELLVGTIRSFSIIKTHRPHVVLGMGGYVNVPGGLAAKGCGVPLVLMNADTTWLLSTRMLSRIAKKILWGLDGLLPVKKYPCVVTGNPIRQDILNVSTVEARYTHRVGPLVVLVLGGSLGAQVLNKTVPQAMALLDPSKCPIIVHQSGKQHSVAVEKTYEALGVAAEVVPFMDNMAHYYERADIVICRSGAITVSELAAVGLASILVPLEIGSTTHQVDNAMYMAEHQAAIYLPQALFSAEKLAEIVEKIKREDCLTLAQRAYQLGKREAVASIIEQIEQCV